MTPNMRIALPVLLVAALCCLLIAGSGEGWQWQ